MNRREVLAGVSAVGVAAAVSAGEAQTATGGLLRPAGGDLAGGSKVFATGAVERTKNANGSERIAVFEGTLATGEALSMHESWVPPGLAAAPKHKITHSEVIVVMEGELEFFHDDIASRAVAGDVIYVAYGTNHAVRNAGTVTARYVVLQVGGDTRAAG